MADADLEISMRRTLDEIRREAKRTRERGVLQKIGRGRFGRVVKAAALSAMLTSQGAGAVGRTQQGQEGARPDRPGTVQRVASQPSQMGGQQFVEQVSPETLSPDEQMDTRREFAQQILQDQRSAQSQPQEAQVAGGVQQDQEKTEKTRSAFSGLRSTVRNLRNLRDQQAKPTPLEGTPEAAALEAAATNSVRAAYTAAHETAEEACLGLADLGIISGPTAIFLYVLRLGAPLWGGFAKINVKGVKVPLIPSYTVPELVVRSSKILLVALITAVVWGLIILIIYAIFNPLDALRQFGFTFMKLLYDMGLITTDVFTKLI